MKIATIMSVYMGDTLPQVQESLKSLYRQTQEHDIFIHIDGPINENLLNFLKQELHNKMIYHLSHSDKNRGLAASLNTLIKIVATKKSYRYIARMDADDIAVPDRYHMQLKLMEKHKNISVCGGWIEEFNEDTQEKQIVKYPTHSEDIKKGMCKRNSVAHVTTMIRLKDIIEVGMYDENKKNEDYTLWVKMLKLNKKIENIPEVLVKVRTSNGFFDRRKDFERAYEVFQTKIDATKSFGCGYKGYIYATAHFLLFMSPSFIKRVAYRHLRK